MRSASLIAGVLFLAGVALGQVPKIQAPDAILRDQPPSISIEGLKPGSDYTVRAEYPSRAGTIWRSDTQFKASDKGVIDLSTMAPVSGAYSGIDPLGVFWSMARTMDRSTDGLTFENDDYSVLNIIIREGDKQIAQHYTILRSRDIGVSTVELRGPVTGTYLAPTKKGKRPGVIVLGGSEGGAAKVQAGLIASHGFPTLALGYFGMEGLPNDLEAIPVETVDRGVDWLARQPGVDARHIVVMGMSKGAELALLAAANNKSIHAVIAIAPSSVLWESIGQGPASRSSWTLGGKDVPFAGYIKTEEYAKSRRLIDLYLPSLEKSPVSSQIEVERIAGPILLISGKNDLLWPSAKMADQIAARLTEKHFHYPMLNRQWEDNGHHVARAPLGPTADSVRLGGTAQSITVAQLEVWREIVGFLNGLRPTKK